MKFLVAMSLLVLLVSVAFAAPERLNFGAQLNAGQCNSAETGVMVVNVVQRVVNDADSGFASPVWAMDDLTRHIQVWQVAPGAFCATVRYQGSWVTVAGPSPMGLGTIAAGITGTMEGGYTAIITGTLKAVPDAKTNGSIGTVDYACSPTTGECPKAFPWMKLYFEPGYAYSMPFWGWIYHGGNNGTWVNAEPSSGDIHN